MTKCPNCGKNRLILESQNEKQFIYICATCKKLVVVKRD